ncbi:MAG: endopeptidase La, partial [Gemmatimonadota bacterium]
MTPPRRRAERYPLLPLRSTAVYPMAVLGVQIGMPSTLEMLSAHPGPGLLAGLVVAPGEPDDAIEPHTLHKVGVLVRVSDRLNLPSGAMQATLQGVRRVRLRGVKEQAGYLTALVDELDEEAPDPERTGDLIARILNALEALSARVDRLPREVPRILRMNLGDPGRFADLVASLANFSVAEKDAMVQLVDVGERLDFACHQLEEQLADLEPAGEGAAPAAEVQEAPAEAPQPRTPAERANLLRQRIQALQAELGQVDPLEREVIELLRRVDAADLPAAVAAQARMEAERLRAIQPGSLEGNDVRSYVDWLGSLPWRAEAAESPGDIDLGAVQRELDEAILGLDDQKERLLDYLAVARLRGDLRGPIPCIVGPPDVGKSSLVAALARGLGRPLAHLELGGRGEAQLVGTRRTRAGASPGKILGALRDAAVRDPVLMLGQIDEIGMGKVEGDPVEAMEEVLDFDERNEFVDRYLDIPFDLTRVTFIATAHDFYKIPRDLRALMAEIRIAGYTAEEKIEIARERLLPRMVADHGLAERDVSFPPEGLSFLVHGYARDAGVGQLRRNVATLLRTRARARAGGDDSTWVFEPERIEKILGLPRYTATPAESAPEVGVVTGLAWTASGGELMFIEALRMPGSGRLIITGSLGDVMRESVNAAYSYVRSRRDALGIDDETFKDADVHVHFPVGAIPKDGPSAGIAVVLALASTLSNRPVRHDIAMTGEVTLRGKVLEIGGVKEKVLAAYRAGIHDVILPSGNERDLRDVPEDVREKTTFHFVDRMDDVLALALHGKKHA